MNKKEENNPYYAIMEGNPVDGFTFTGPFSFHEDAVEYSENHVEMDWWIIEIDQPEQ